MVTPRDIRRAVAAADRRTKTKEKAARRAAKSLSTSKGKGKRPADEGDCTPEQAGRVLGRLSRLGRGGPAPARKKASRDKAPKKATDAQRRKSAPKASSSAEAPRKTAERGGSAPPSPTPVATVGIDKLLADLEAAPEAKGRRVERKHVAKALRKMLHARHRRVSFSVQVKRGAKSSSLEVVPGRGAKQFTDQHRKALLDFFGDAGGSDNTFTVLVSRLSGDSTSAATGIRVELAERFRRRLAEAAGLGMPSSKAPTPVSSDNTTAGAGPSFEDMVRSGEVVLLPEERAANSRPPDRAAPSSPKKTASTTPESRPSATGATTESPDPVRMDHVLRDLEREAKAKGGYVERKHVAKALREMLNARHKGFSVKTPNRSFATTIDVLPARGSSRFTDEHHAAIWDVFGANAGRSSFLVLVSPFISDSSSIPTGIRPEHIGTFRRLVAKAAGLGKPPPFAPPLPRVAAEARPRVFRDSGDDPKSGEALGIGRKDHTERREARAERLRARAAKARAEADARFEASKHVPPGGEPIKVGHHSETRHRRMLERAQTNASKAFEMGKKAERLLDRAGAAERNSAISSDDPRALERLQDKLARLEAERQETKRKNRLARAGELPDSQNPPNPPALQQLIGERRYPMPGYALRNLGAEIRRVRERIEELSKRVGREARSLERGGVRVVENGDISRLQIFTEGKPPQENRTWLKRNGFRWARSEGAWQRQLGDPAWNLGMMYLDTFVEKRCDTPYQRVEQPRAKPRFTEKDVAFWRDEFAALDAEFPGEFDGAMLEKVAAALRARKAGHPPEQAFAYGKVRVGQWTLHRAVEELYQYRRFAKPRPRPKRSPKTVTSSMSAEDFIANVSEKAKDLRGLFAARVPARARRDSVTLSHYNVPAGVRNGAALENNRLTLTVDGWERDGSAPKTGKVKLEVLVSATLSGLRGRTTTPEKMVGVVMEMLERNAAQEQR